MAKLVPTQIEQLQRIGEHLHQVRLERDASIDDIANQIFIRPALLKAIEEGNDDHLPEPVFIQGFIRRYADALGLDGRALSQEFPITPPRMELPEPVIRSEQNGSAINATAANGAVAPDVAAPEATNSAVQLLEKAEPGEPTSRRSSPASLFGILAAVALAVGLGIWAVLSLGNSTQPSNAGRDSGNTATATGEAGTSTDPTEIPSGDDGAEAAAPEAGEAPEAAPEEVSEEAPSAPPEEAPPEEAVDAPVVVSIDLAERSWMSVIVDGSRVYEGTQESGYQETWTAAESIVLTSGNAGGVNVAVNNSDYVSLGASGDVKTVTVTPDTDPESISAP